MKCPKCQYISFDSPERCRNCGYDFAPAPGATPPPDEARLRSDAADGPMPDLSLGERRSPEPTPAARLRSRQDGFDLPLFNEPIPGLDDTPLISTAAAPRVPLAVRRGTPEPSRVPRPPRKPARPETIVAKAPSSGAPTPPALGAARRTDSTVDPPASPPGEAGRWQGPPVRRREAEAERDDAGAAAPAVPRLLALAIDLGSLVVTDLIVVHFTLAILRTPWSRLLDLPVLPLAAFCLLLNAGYVVAFTVASGQTIGKMVTGIRIVSDASWRVPVAQAVLRAALAPLSLLTLGLGYLPALVGSDRRALHDRLSNTRVVRA
jgi:uncharacterized RDD family membrane protein YckC